LAVRSTLDPQLSEDSNAPKVAFAVVEGWGADGAGVRSKDDPTGDDDDPTGALPEICQKLRYT
jgi:hypothetical protein